MARVLEFCGVEKRFGSVAAVRPIDLALPAGETSVLLGPSGSGKSTLLRLLIGLVWPDRGSVRLSGEPLRRETLSRARRRMGYVIQDGGLFPHMTAEENATLPARHRKLAGIPKRLAELVALTRFPESGLKRYPGQLSGGQRQRVALMRALFLDPEILLLDEPLASLDPLIRAELQEDLRAIFHRLKKTVVLVTHDLREAAFLADTIVLLREGAVVQRGTLREFRDTPADPFVTRFLDAQKGPLEGA